MSRRPLCERLRIKSVYAIDDDIAIRIVEAIEAIAKALS